MTGVQTCALPIYVRTWSDAREPLAGAMGAAIATLAPHWVGASSAAAAAALDPQRVAALSEVMNRWWSRSFPEWFTEQGLEIPPPTGEA